MAFDAIAVPNLCSARLFAKPIPQTSRPDSISYPTALSVSHIPPSKAKAGRAGILLIIE